jgi:hypothetical protein
MLAYRKVSNSYLCTYDLYAFDAGSIYYAGKWEGVGPWKSRLFWACEMSPNYTPGKISNILPFHSFIVGANYRDFFNCFPVAVSYNK